MSIFTTEHAARLMNEMKAFYGKVHGDIRHLEKQPLGVVLHQRVHGDIRHLETHQTICHCPRISSWRHTPFRKQDDEGKSD